MKAKMRLPSGHSKSARQASALTRDGLYQLKVVLAGSEPPIWRRIQVPGGFTLAGLHKVLQEAMGWEDDHLHEFFIGGASYGASAAADNLFAPDIRNESRIQLKDILPAAGKSFRYIYDFGDDWIHEITVEKIVLPAERVSYPLCLAGENACPPEDSGGIYSYYGKLEIIKDTKHPEHAEIKEWMGPRFDPSRFNLEAVNRRLRGLLKA
jgi:hypothetical protein